MSVDEIRLRTEEAVGLIAGIAVDRLSDDDRFIEDLGLDSPSIIESLVVGDEFRGGRREVTPVARGIDDLSDEVWCRGSCGGGSLTRRPIQARIYAPACGAHGNIAGCGASMPVERWTLGSRRPTAEGPRGGNGLPEESTDSSGSGLL